MHPHARKATRKPSTKEHASDAPWWQTDDFWKDYDKWWREVLERLDRDCAELVKMLHEPSTWQGG